VSPPNPECRDAETAFAPESTERDPGVQL
jgi:hypothetical protein